MVNTPWFDTPRRILSPTLLMVLANPGNAIADMESLLYFRILEKE
jgi:hypothetical protein